MTDPSRLSALDAAAAIASGSLTSEALVQACLDRIAEREKTLHAWIYLDPQAALDEARKRDKEPRRSPLHGVPVGVKDIVDTHDMPTEYGSAIYPRHRPAWDAACVAHLRHAGMVVLGKTVTTEFAMRQAGKTTNPHDPHRTPGGSSSGSAAAVGDYMVPLAIGTQTAGSIIRPASYCGVVGYKPTFGVVPRMGVKMISDSLDTIGGMARTVADAGAFIQAMAGLPIEPLVPLANPPRIGFCRSPAWNDANAAAQASIAEAVARMRAAGAVVVDIDLPPAFDEAAEAHGLLMPFEGAQLLADERYRHFERMGERTRGVMDQGRLVTAEQYRWSRRVQAHCRQAIGAVFEFIDVLLTPAAPGEAPEGLIETGNPTQNRIWSLTGVPCVTVPGLVGPHGMPIGVQVVGPMDGDAATLAAADWIHRALIA